MNTRPHPAYALALATALVGTTPLAAGADEPDELVTRCYTEALTVDEVEAGAVSDIDCYEVSADAPQARSSLSTLAVLYDVSSTTGTELYVTGSSCTGASVNFGAGNPWDNKVSATDLYCGSAKHYTGANFTGNTQVKSPAGYHVFTGAWDNVTSSIEYA